MPRDLNDMIPSRGEISTLHVALEVSDRNWVLAIGAPLESGRASMHRLAPADTAALAGKIGNACAAMEGPVRVLLTCEVGHEGFRLARWFGELDTPRIDVVVCDPASLEVVRRVVKWAKTDRVDARRTVRALRAWDRGEVEVLSRVRIPTLGEQDPRRLMRRRVRPAGSGRTRVRRDPPPTAHTGTKPGSLPLGEPAGCGCNPAQGLVEPDPAFDMIPELAGPQRP